ncbi:MAG: hypothetical protein HY015_11160 [Bacteroidetes bacterium]|nr:hypothetical protein [Bacteroidota bacterium]MBI3483509.1 hypothetical protein [Bacteroidota bacterium]
MKINIFFLITLIPLLGTCQDRSNSLLIHPNDKFEIRNEDKVIKFTFGNPNYVKIDTVRAELSVNNDPIREIHFTKAKLRNNILTIVINSTTSAYHQVYTIEIADGKCKADYTFRPSGPDYELAVVSLEYIVIVNHADFGIGKEIRGYTEFKGKCKGEGCYGEENFEIKGNFKVLIR